MTEVCQIWEDGEAITSHSLFTICIHAKAGINGQEPIPNSWKVAIPPSTHSRAGKQLQKDATDASNLHGLKEELSMYLKEKLIAHEGLTAEFCSHYSWPCCQQWD